MLCVLIHNGRIRPFLKNMKFLYTSLLVVGLAFSACAQQMSLPDSPPVLYASSEPGNRLYGNTSFPAAERRMPTGLLSIQRQQYVIPKLPGERMMTVGKVLTGIGAVSVITGILVYNNRDPEYYTRGSYNNTYTEDPHEIGGQLLVGIGCGMIVPGVMVWIHGANKFRKHAERTAQQQGFYVPAGKAGLGYRF